MICIIDNLCIEEKEFKIYNKQDIMDFFKCESDKALRILKVMYQMKMANKIGKEYYVTQDTLIEFLNQYRGEEIII